MQKRLENSKFEKLNKASSLMIMNKRLKESVFLKIYKIVNRKNMRKRKLGSYYTFHSNATCNKRKVPNTSSYRKCE